MVCCNYPTNWCRISSINRITTWQTVKRSPKKWPTFHIWTPSASILQNRQFNNYIPRYFTCPLTRHHLKHTRRIPTSNHHWGANLVSFTVQKACFLPLFTGFSTFTIFHLSTVSFPTFTICFCTSHTLTRSITRFGAAASTSGTSGAATFGGFGAAESIAD